MTAGLADTPNGYGPAQFHGAYSSEKAKRDVPEFRCEIDFPRGAAQTLEDIRRRGLWRDSRDDALYESMVEKALAAYTRSDSQAIQVDVEQQFQRFPVLAQRRRQLAGTLSGGEQQMLAIARALMSRPRLLLLDEPSLGLAPLVVRAIFGTIKELHAAGVTILLVEQNAHAALQIADRGYVLEAGRLAMSGPAASLLTDDRVRRAYLG